MNNVLLRIQTALDQPGSKIYLGLLLAIISVGTFLRLYGAIVGHGYHAFAINDELSAYEYALRYLAGDQQAQYLGQPFFRGGQVPGPFWTIFWVILLKLGSGSVPMAIIWMSFFNAIAILLIYLLAKQFFNSRYTLLATLIFALGPWPVYYSAGMWNPMPLVVFGGVLFLLLLKVTKNESSQAVFWVCVVSAILPQFHMNSIFYIPAVLLLLYAMPVKLNQKWFALGVVAGCLLYIPYIAGEAINGWENTLKILAGENNKGFSFSVLKIISAPVTVLSAAPGRWAGETIAELKDFGNAWFGHYSVMVAFAGLSLLAGLVYFVSFIIKAFNLLRQHHFSLPKAYSDSPSVIFLATLIILPLLLFLPTGHNYATRYTILIFTLLFLLPVWFISGIKNKRFKKIVVVQLLVTMIFNVYLSIAFFNYQDNRLFYSNKFIASFDMLEFIRNKVSEDAGKMYRIRLRLDDSVNKLPEINRKTIRALVEYTDIYQKHVEYKDESVTEKNYLVKLPSTNHNDANVIHRANGIIIVSQ